MARDRTEIWDHLYYCQKNYLKAIREFGGTGQEEEEWESIVLRAAKTKDARQQKALCMKAIKMGARSPWPYERLAILYGKEKDIKAAYQVCRDYFLTDNWMVPNWSTSAIRLLKRLESLEKRIRKPLPT